MSGSFGLRISSSNHRSWVVLYRVGHRLRRFTIGDYERLSLADARRRAKEILHLAEKGEDPGTEKSLSRKAETFAQLADEYMERHAKVNKRSWKDDERMLKADVLPHFGTLKAKEIRRRDVMVLLDHHVTRGAPIVANRVLALVRKIFNFALQRDIVEFNPCQAISRPVEEKSRQGQRVLSLDELKSVWESIEKEDLLIAGIFKLRILSAQRGSEIRSMEWSEIDFESGWWTIPGTKTKNKLDHRVPLTPQILEILEAIVRKDLQSKFVFPSPVDKDHHIDNIQKAFQRIKGRVKIDFWDRDLRRTAASHMTGELGIPRLVVSKILNHVESGITKVYDRHGYDKEKKSALIRWNELVMNLVNSRAQKKILNFRSKVKESKFQLKEKANG